MALQEQLGSMAIQVEADLTKWKHDVEELKTDAKKDAEEIEKSYAKIGPAGVKSISGLVRSFKGIDAAIVNNIKSTNDLIKVNDNLYLEVSKKTGKLISTYRILDDVIQKNVKGNIQGWQTLGKVGETELNKTSRSVRIFGSGIGDSSRKLSLLGYEVARAAGETGKFGSLLGQVGAGMLVGGYIGAGLAAGAAAINLIAEKTRQLTQTIRDALSKLIDFKDSFKDIKFEIDTGNIRKQTEFIEERISQLQENIAERDVKLLKLRSTSGSDEVLIKFLEKQNELDEKRITVNEEYLGKLKEQKDLEDALGITKEELNNLGLKELTIADKVNTQLVEQKELIEDLRTALSDPTIKGEERLVLQNKLNGAIEDYNSLIGKQDENKSVDDLIKKIKTENDLKALTTGLTSEILESSKQLLQNSLSLAKTDEDRVKILSTIRDIEKEIAELSPAFDIEEIDAGKFAEELSKGFAEAEEKRQQAEREAAELIQELRLRGIANEFDERRARIEAEYELLLEKYKDNAEIVSEIEKARQTDLLRLEHERFTTMLSFANQIGDILINKLNVAGHTFVGQMLRALDIAASILSTLSNLSGALGGSGGLFGLFASFIPGGGLIATAAGALAGGGPVERNKLYKVGERGEEWFRPWTSGTIIPNHQIASNLSHSGGSTLQSNGNVEAKLTEISNRIGAMNENLVLKDFNVMVKNEAPGVKSTVRTGEKVKTQLNIAGANLSEH
jgi:hypothetical protein